jgi:hypothetical protein
MVKKHSCRVLALLAVLSLSTCEIFTVTPFPDFVDKTDISIDLSREIDAIAGGQSTISYQLTVVDNPNPVFPPRVLLLVEPPSSDPNVGFDYKGKLIFMDRDLKVLNRVGTGSSLDYFSKPYAYAHDGNVLAGYTVLTPDGGTTTVGTLNPPPGLEGFALTNGAVTETDIFATPSGQYASFNISYIGYNTAGLGWGIVLPAGTLSIVPPPSLPSSSDPNYANLGYQLVGLAYNSVTDEITFVLSEPAQGRIVAARMGRVAATSGSGVLLPSAGSWPVAASAWPVEVDVDRPALFADVDGFFLVRRDGWMERYTWNAAGTPLILTGAPVKIVGDRSLSRRYAFLVPQTAGLPTYMYRFDPSSKMLTRYRRWW